MNRPRLKRALSVLYALIIAACTFLFFTNDFGLVDLRKTAVVIGVGLDIEEEEVVLTAQLAVPQPAENGENTKFNVVTGKGSTVAAALNEVNVKTGFYPKLVFCKLIVLGESCFNQDIIKLLDYFYRNEYTGLTLLVAACEGQAKELIAQQFPCGNSATDVIEKLLSSEAKASGNVCAVTLKDIGESSFSQSKSAFMPYLENGILKESGGGGESGGSGGGSGGGGGAGQQCEESELTCNKCAMFSNGYCKGVLTTEQTFAFNLIKNEVRHAFVESSDGDKKRILGLRDCKGGVDISFEDEQPVMQIKFSASVNVQDSELGFEPDRAANIRIPEEILKQGEKTIEGLFSELFNSTQQADCDIFGATTQLYKSNYKKYGEYEENFFANLKMESEVSLKSAG